MAAITESLAKKFPKIAVDLPATLNKDYESIQKNIKELEELEEKHLG